jgi:hypothetical protein
LSPPSLRATYAKTSLERIIRMERLYPKRSSAYHVINNV